MCLKNLMDVLGCILHNVEMERRQRSTLGIGKLAEVMEHQMAPRAAFRGILALVSLIRDNKRIQFVIPDFNAAMNIRRDTVLGRRPKELV